MKKKVSKWSLYRKEQLLIMIILLCFVLSGTQLPKIKKQLFTPPIVNTEPLEEIPSEDVATSETVEPKPNKAPVKNNEKTTEKPDKTPPTKTPSTKVPETSQKKDTTKKEKPKKQKPVKKPEKETEDKKPSTDDEKVWVPPVYEVIHHDAVYETKKVVICNYCSENFDSVGDFQVHKNANGG